MVSGAVISNRVSFDISNLRVDGQGVPLADIVASESHEIWLESTGASLRELAVWIHVNRLPDVATTSRARLRRDRDGVHLDFALTQGDIQKFELLNAWGAATSTATLIFDVEYAEGYDSPAGYSPASGIHYWDDVAYPSVEADAFEFGDR